METIIRIEEVDGHKINKGGWQSFIGYNVITNEQTIFVGVSDMASCCEKYGHLTTNDNLDDFKNAKLLSIDIVDKALNKKKLDEVIQGDYDGALMFVNFETDKGTLQLVAYNIHNGYYGHDAVVISKQLNHEVTL